MANTEKTNYLGHWLLTYHLLPLLQATSASSPVGQVRVVNLTSDGHQRFTVHEGIRFEDPELKNESAMTRYGHSKLANILHTKQLHRLHGAWLVTAAVHPGHIDT